MLRRCGRQAEWARQVDSNELERCLPAAIMPVYFFEAPTSFLF